MQWNFHLTDKIGDFLRNKDCFLIPKMDLRSIAQHVLASVAARKNRIFSLRIAHIVHSL